MQKLLRFKLLTMIVLLNCSTSWCQNDNTTISSTGGLTAKSDSILIAYDYLRKANAKMVELKYEKEINDSLLSIIANDEIIIGEYNRKVDALNKQIKQENRKYKVTILGGLLISLSLGTLLIFK